MKWSPMRGLLALFIIPFCFVSCDKSEVSFNSSDLIGKWKENGSSTYWRYDSGGSGLTWDESEDVSEDDETTMRFSWSLSEDVLQHVFSGDEIHQAVVQDYTILELSNTSLRWNTGLKTVTLSKVN